MAKKPEWNWIPPLAEPLVCPNRAKGDVRRNKSLCHSTYKRSGFPQLVAWVGGLDLGLTFWFRWRANCGKPHPLKLQLGLQATEPQQGSPAAFKPQGLSPEDFCPCNFSPERGVGVPGLTSTEVGIPNRDRTCSKPLISSPGAFSVAGFFLVAQEGTAGSKRVFFSEEGWWKQGVG